MELILNILAWMGIVFFCSSSTVLATSRRARESKVYCKVLLLSLIISLSVFILSFLTLLIFNL